MQNMLLPHTPVQEFFIIGSSGCTHSKYVHNIKENPGHFYTYHEGQSQKRPNENWWPDYFKKTCSTLNQGDSSKRETFAVSNYKQFLYESSSPGYVRTWVYINGLHSDIIKLLKEHKENPPLPNNGAYEGSPDCNAPHFFFNNYLLNIMRITDMKE
nr:unnamed protein product [Callosobruchus analis]